MAFTRQCTVGARTVARGFLPRLHLVPRQVRSIATPTVYGLPPEMSDTTEKDILKRFRILKITPGRVRMKQKAWCFKFEETTEEFCKRLSGLLANLGISHRPSFPIKFAVNVEQVEVSTMNDYQGNIFARAVNWAGSLARQLRQVGIDVEEEGFLSRVLNRIAELSQGIFERTAESDYVILNALSGRVNLPMLWEDSSCSTEYRFTIHLVGHADPDNLWKQVFTPLCILLVLAAPPIMGSGLAYREPPYVRASCDGVMYVPLGLISDLSISRLPKYYLPENKCWGCRVDLTIKSLFGSMVYEKSDVADNINAADYLKTLMNSWR